MVAVADPPAHTVTRHAIPDARRRGRFSGGRSVASLREARQLLLGVGPLAGGGQRRLHARERYACAGARGDRGRWQRQQRRGDSVVRRGQRERQRAPAECGELGWQRQPQRQLLAAADTRLASHLHCRGARGRRQQPGRMRAKPRRQQWDGPQEGCQLKAADRVPRAQPARAVVRRGGGATATAGDLALLLRRPAPLLLIDRLAVAGPQREGAAGGERRPVEAVAGRRRAFGYQYHRSKRGGDHHLPPGPGAAFTSGGFHPGRPGYPGCHTAPSPGSPRHPAP